MIPLRRYEPYDRRRGGGGRRRPRAARQHAAQATPRAEQRAEERAEARETTESLQNPTAAEKARRTHMYMCACTVWACGWQAAAPIDHRAASGPERDP